MYLIVIVALDLGSINVAIVAYDYPKCLLLLRLGLLIFIITMLALTPYYLHASYVDFTISMFLLKH